MAERAGLIVSVSGIRGIVGDSLTPETVTSFAAALASSLQGSRIILGRDSRPSGRVLRHAVLAGLLAAGADVEDIGVASTPTVGLAIRQLRAAGGIQITASHNPAPWNGLKMFGPEGRVLTAAEGRAVVERFRSGDVRRVSHELLGIVTDQHHADEWHLRRVLEQIDVPRIRARQFHTFLDANGSAGGPLGLQLLDALQSRPSCQGGYADGSFLHEPEPTEENLRGVCPLIPGCGADVGFAIDPDADRLAVIDENGRYIGEELTLALAVLQRLRYERGPVVINMSTSRVVEDIAARFDCTCHRSAVGEANVVAKMKEVGALIGGEGNGGVIDPRVGWVRDPYIGIGLILNLMADTQKTLSALVAELPAYTIVKQKFSVDAGQLPRLFDALASRWPEASVNREDGLRLAWPDRWVQVRASNTEPIVRVIAEAPQAADALRLCEDAGGLLSR